MASATHEIENFDTQLRDTKILTYSPNLPLIAAATAGAPLMQRRILIAPHPAKTLFAADWDAIFQVPGAGSGAAAGQGQAKDWTLILTYLTHAPKPALVYIEDGVEFPEQFVHRLPASITLIVQRSLGSRTAAATWADTVFFPPVADALGAEAGSILTALDRLVGPAHNHGERTAWLRELRSVGAGLVWTRSGEPKAHGAIYWYDPNDYISLVKPPHASTIAAHLKTLAKALDSAN